MIGFLNITINYNRGVDFPCRRSTSHMTCVRSFISLLQFVDNKNAVKHHISPALCDTPTD